MAAIEIDGLTKRFGDVVAVDGLGLHIEEGGFSASLGRTTFDDCRSIARARRAGRRTPGPEPPSAFDIHIRSSLRVSSASQRIPENRNSSLLKEYFIVNSGHYIH